MTTVKLGRCDTCGADNNQDPSEIVLVHYGDLTEMSYRFHCLDCGEKNDRPATPKVVTILEVVGVPVCRIDPMYDQLIDGINRLRRSAVYDIDPDEFTDWLHSDRFYDDLRSLA